MTGTNPRSGKRLRAAAVMSLQLGLTGVLGFSLHQLHQEIKSTQEGSELAMEMILATYTLRQSSDYLTRYARQYVVTGDPAWRDVYQQVLDIRQGQALRPKDYESVYWDLIEPYRSNAHPLLYPQSLRSIIETLPFTQEELALLEAAERSSEDLAQVELAAFEAAGEGLSEDAAQTLFSVDYLKAKHAIMQPIDELMVAVRRRIERERAASLSQSRQLVMTAYAAAGLMLLVTLLLLMRPRRRAKGTSPGTSPAKA